MCKEIRKNLFDLNKFEVNVRYKTAARYICALCRASWLSVYQGRNMPLSVNYVRTMAEDRGEGRGAYALECVVKAAVAGVSFASFLPPASEAAQEFTHFMDTYGIPESEKYQAVVDALKLTFLHQHPKISKRLFGAVPTEDEIWLLPLEK